MPKVEIIQTNELINSQLNYSGFLQWLWLLQGRLAGITNHSVAYKRSTLSGLVPTLHKRDTTILAGLAAADPPLPMSIE